ncbi:MAG: hypothetical protein JXA08_05045 [Methanomicrobiaceae archaeon]|nr:hypothetical protein [Methanomicrobiaceae archaeon]
MPPGGFAPPARVERSAATGLFFAVRIAESQPGACRTEPTMPPVFFQGERIPALLARAGQ